MPETELTGNKQMEPVQVLKPLDPRNNMASGFIERMKEIICDYRKELNEDEFLHVQVVLNDSRCITAKVFGWYDPHLVTISGIDSHGNKIKALMNPINVQITLTVFKKRFNEKKVDLEFQKGYG